MEVGSRSLAVELYERVASARVDCSLIADVIEEACESTRLRLDRDEVIDRLTDEDHAAVLQKEVTDVVVLVTGAMEAKSVQVYRDFVLHVERQVTLDSYDDVTAIVRQVLARKMAEAALDDIVDGRDTVIANLRIGLEMLGDTDPFFEHEVPAAAAKLARA
ncbi:hypothetical protein [Xanthomonas arboricola]|uniref:Uncharacterized protein n=1 Tax=Xanthomonas arboricola TaxID=56448 RepID=A0AB73H1U5_9XANT|nr:hypothetical protein [Xanthomonas arboricola]MBB5672307.1 hypothetical protein [Xanthomonas arboricola]